MPTHGLWVTLATGLQRPGWTESQVGTLAGFCSVPSLLCAGLGSAWPSPKPGVPIPTSHGTRLRLRLLAAPLARSLPGCGQRWAGEETPLLSRGAERRPFVRSANRGPFPLPETRASCLTRKGLGAGRGRCARPGLPEVAPGWATPHNGPASDATARTLPAGPPAPWAAQGCPARGSAHASRKPQVWGPRPGRQNRLA